MKLRHVVPLTIMLILGARGPGSAQTGESGSLRGVPSLEELAGSWQDAARLASLPAVNNTVGSAQVLREVLAVGKLSFPPIVMSGSTGVMLIDGSAPALDRTRWYAYGAVRKGTTGGLAVATEVRMVYEERGILFHCMLTNPGKTSRKVILTIGLSANTSLHTRWAWKVPRSTRNRALSAATADGGRSLLVRDTTGELANCFSFERRPDALRARGDSGEAVWRLTLRPGGSAVVNYALAVGREKERVHGLALQWASHFDPAFQQVKKAWQGRYEAMFTPKNTFFSGHLPVVHTPDSALRRLYYIGVVSLLSVLRTGFPVAPRVYVSNTPESNCTMMYFWDTREWATTLALLDPLMLKQYLLAWLSKGVYKGYAEEYLTGTLQGPWYSANDLSVFILLNDYLNVTGDTAFLSDTAAGTTVLQHMDSIAVHWMNLVRPGHILADYGGAENLLECVPTYIHEVASFNAANVWMMRRVAAIRDDRGDSARARELRTGAERLLHALLALYEPGKGFWDALHRDGTKVPIRHVFDFATIGLTIPEDLTPAMRKEMVDFAERELLTDHWMRAQSLSDIAAGVSDRPDHGPMGAYCAWPPETMAAMCEFGEFGRALDFLHRCVGTTYEGPFSQSRELLGRTRDAPVRINERGNAGLPTQTYNASNGGGFTETIIREFFGFKPDFIRGTVVPDTRPRGFRGELLNVQGDHRLLTVHSSDEGLHVEPAQ